MKTPESQGLKMYKSILIIGLFVFSATSTFAQIKLAQTGAQFLSVGSDARAAGIGESMTANALGSASLFYNPAGMASLSNEFEFSASQNRWIADILHNSFSIALKINNDDRYGVFGASMMSVDYGDIQGTVVWPNDPGFIDTDILTPTAKMIGFGYAIALNDKFSVGGQAKYIGLNFGYSLYPDAEGNPTLTKKNLLFANGFDFGTLYRTGWKTLAFGMSVRNFSNEVKFEEEGFQLPLTFSMGLSMDVFDLISETHKGHNLLVSIDALHYRARPEQVRIGAEYTLSNSFSLRSGYQSNTDETSMSYGFGLNLFGINLDYAYTPFGIWNEVQRFTIRFGI
jgi:hypothetical protein